MSYKQPHIGHAQQAVPCNFPFGIQFSAHKIQPRLHSAQMLNTRPES